LKKKGGEKTKKITKKCIITPKKTDNELLDHWTPGMKGGGRFVKIVEGGEIVRHLISGMSGKGRKKGEGARLRWGWTEKYSLLFFWLVKATSCHHK